LPIDPLIDYQEITVRLWGKGVVSRGYVKGSELPTAKRFVAQTGQFILSRIDARHGANGLIPPELNGAIATNDFPLFDIDRTRLEPRYLQWLGRTRDFVERCLRSSEGTTNRVRLSEERFLSLPIPLPPITEQRRVVECIETLAVKADESKSLRRQASQRLSAFWPAVLNDALRGHLSPIKPAGGSARTIIESLVARHQGFAESKANNAHPDKPNVVPEGPYALPEGWLWVSLGSVLTHLVDCVNDTPEFASDNTGYLGLKSTNIRPYVLDLSQRWFVTKTDFDHWNRRATPQAGDIILTREAPVGYACQLPPQIVACLTQRIMLLRADPEAILPQLLLHYLNSPVFLDQVFERARGLTTPHIRVQDAPHFLLPLPPMPQQELIADVLNGLQTKVDGVKNLHATTVMELESILPAVLDKAFRGEL
jgi:type I restriction enzyme S subunit